MSEPSDKATAASKLEAAKLKAEKLRAMQAEAEREIAEAEALEATRKSEQELAKAKRGKEALHRAAEKQRLREEQRAAALAAEAAAATAASATAVGEAEDDSIELGDVREPVDELHAETGSRRKRIGLRCFNCNRLEGHYLLFYRQMWYSYIIGLTFGLAVIVGPYRCQCCGASRFMVSNLLHPKYYLSLMSTRSKSKSNSRSSRR